MDFTMFQQPVYWVAKGVFKKMGYHWELRHSGEIKIGYLKKSFKNRNKKNPYPKRFVFVPGFGDSPLSWSFVLLLLDPVLKARFDEVVLFDFPGFGGFLTREKTFPSLDMMIRTFQDALDSLRPHTIFGHSLGGWLTAHYAALCGVGSRPLSHPKNYSGPETIILANPSGIFPDEKVKKDLAERYLAARTDGFEALRPYLFAKEPWWLQYFLSSFSEFTTRDDTILFMDSVREDHAIDQSVKDIQAKVWIIWGEKDTLVPISCAQAWMSHLEPARQENHRLVILKNVGHSPHLEKPGILAVVLGQILLGKTPHPRGKKWWTVSNPADRFSHQTP